MKNTLKHAFSIDDSESFKPNEKQKLIIDKVCREVVKRHLALPAQIMLETFRPLNYIGSQLLHFFQPIITTVLKRDGYVELTAFLEKRGSVDYICGQIKKIQDEQDKYPQKKKG